MTKGGQGDVSRENSVIMALGGGQYSPTRNQSALAGTGCQPEVEDNLGGPQRPQVTCRKPSLAVCLTHSYHWVAEGSQTLPCSCFPTSLPDSKNLFWSYLWVVPFQLPNYGCSILFHHPISKRHLSNTLRLPSWQTNLLLESSGKERWERAVRKKSVTICGCPLVLCRGAFSRDTHWLRQPVFWGGFLEKQIDT